MAQPASPASEPDEFAAIQRGCPVFSETVNVRTVAFQFDGNTLRIIRPRRERLLTLIVGLLLAGAGVTVIAALLPQFAANGLRPGLLIVFVPCLGAVALGLYQLQAAMATTRMIEFDFLGQTMTVSFRRLWRRTRAQLSLNGLSAVRIGSAEFLALRRNKLRVYHWLEIVPRPGVALRLIEAADASFVRKLGELISQKASLPLEEWGTEKSRWRIKG